MDEPWKNFVSPWWPSGLGIDAGVSLLPSGGADEPWRAWWPTIVPTSWPTLFSSSPPQGGLLASLNARASGGLLGRLAAPVEHLDFTNYGGIWPSLSRTRAELMPGDHYDLTSVPRSPSWEALSTPVDAGVAESLPAPPSRSPSDVSTDSLKSEPWTESGDEAKSVPQTLSDVTPDNYWLPGADYAGEGHHEFPRALYKRMPPETQKVFDRATSGQLHLGFDNRRHEFDSFHQEYNRAIGELLKRFMGEQNIREPEQMPPDHAHAVLKAIAESEDPRIRLYREFIRQLRLFYRLRIGGRGSE